MKDFFKDITDKDSLFIIFISLLVGLVIGVFFQSGYSVSVKTAIHNLSMKLNPDSQKDTKTIIMDKAETYYMPHTIYDEPKKKENKFILFIKKIIPKKEAKHSINNWKE